MNIRRPSHLFKRSLLAAALAPLSVLAASQAMAQEPLEEVLITGSYIKSTGTDEASPVQVIDSDYIIDNFTLDRVTKSAAIFDHEKLLWTLLNLELWHRQYVR